MMIRFNQPQTQGSLYIPTPIVPTGPLKIFPRIQLSFRDTPQPPAKTQLDHSYFSKFRYFSNYVEFHKKENKKTLSLQKCSFATLLGIAHNNAAPTDNHICEKCYKRFSRKYLMSSPKNEIKLYGRFTYVPKKLLQSFLFKWGKNYEFGIPHGQTLIAHKFQDDHTYVTVLRPTSEEQEYLLVFDTRADLLKFFPGEAENHKECYITVTLCPHHRQPHLLDYYCKKYMAKRNSQKLREKNMRLAKKLEKQ